MKKKVLHVINSLTSGGAENLLVNSLAPGGLQEHTENYIAFFQGTSGIAGRIDERVKVIPLNYKGLPYLPGTLLKLRRIIRDLKIDIVHTHLNPAGLYTHLCIPLQVPQVHTLHTTYSMDTETSRLKLLLEREGYFKKKSCNIILLSDYTKADFLSSVPFKGRAFVLNNFVPDQYFDIQPMRKNDSGGTFNVMAAGTLKAIKNFEYLLQVFRYLKEKDIALDIYGEGDRAAYEKVIGEQGLKVRMMGPVPQLSEVLPAYDLFIMPSKFEGFPLTVFEAMAAGIPLMLSDIPPLTSIVKEHAIYFGLDDAEKAASQLAELTNDRSVLHARAVRAKQYAETTVRRDIYIQRLLAIYNEVIQQER